MKISYMRCTINDIVFTAWYHKDYFKKDKPLVGIMCHGLPSHPYQHSPAKIENLILDGWLLIYPNYRGTWASKGNMSWEGCTGTIIEIAEFLNKGDIKDIKNQELHFTNPRLVLMGGSFGGSVALVAGAKSSLIKDIVCVTGPTDWKNHADIQEEPGEPFDELYHRVIKDFGPLWRIPSQKEWLRLEKGIADLNPVDYSDDLSVKNVFLVYGKEDDVVSSIRGIELYNDLKKGSGNHKLILLNRGHCDYNIFSEDKLYKELSLWLK